jgi:aconitate hydratase
MTKEALPVTTRPAPDLAASRAQLRVGDTSYAYHRLDAAGVRDLAHLPYTVKVILENLLRQAVSGACLVSADDVGALAAWDAKNPGEYELPFLPARVILQDFTGVPCVVDLAAMRDAMAEMGGDPSRINPLVPADLVIDHSVQVDQYGTAACSSSTSSGSTSATASAMRCSGGRSRRSATSGSSRPGRASATR